jgi:hypothetical protein
MPRRVEEEDWDDGDEAWGEAEDDVDEPLDDDDEPTVPCPYCRREIHEDSQRCPYCEHYISEEDAPPARKPLWIIIGAGLCLFVVYLWVVG